MEIKPCNGMRQTCAAGTSGARGALSAHWKRSGCGWSGCGGALSALGTPHGTNILRLALNGYLTSGTGSLDARDRAMSTLGEGAAHPTTAWYPKRYNSFAHGSRHLNARG